MQQSKDAPQSRKIRGKVLLPVLLRDLEGIFSLAPWVPGDSDRSTDHVARGYLLREIGSKYADPDPSSKAARETAAFAKWQAAEDRCAETNLRLTRPIPASCWDVGGVLYYAEKFIFEQLGPFRWSEAIAHAGFGPGASITRTRAEGGYTHKLCGNHEVTLSCLPLLDSFRSCFPAIDMEIAQSGETIVEAARWQTVPKSSTIDRVIAIEPSWNMFFQKGIGRVIRARLKPCGVDLDQQVYNQEMAKLGSLYGNLATLDLSSASDTISYGIVKRLLPEDWFEALEQTRTSHVALPSGPYRLKKFSSMGNGYTFELESLIFWAICRGVLRYLNLKDQRLCVYGDDMIVPVSAVQLLSKVLDYCGFILNPEKSFSAGYFRESCGKHFYKGRDITPIYVRRPVDTLQELFLLHNNLWRWAGRTELTRNEKLAMRTLLSRIRGIAPAEWRKSRIPDGVGDGAFIGTFDIVRPDPLCGLTFTDERLGPLIPRELYVPEDLRAFAGWEGFVTSHLVERAVPDLKIDQRAALTAWFIRAAQRDCREQRAWRNWFWDKASSVTSIASRHRRGFEEPEYDECLIVVRQFEGLDPFAFPAS